MAAYPTRGRYTQIGAAEYWQHIARPCRRALGSLVRNALELRRTDLDSAGNIVTKRPERAL